VYGSGLKRYRCKAEHLHGIVEFDETYFLESHKGERHLEHKPRKCGLKSFI